MIQPSTVETRVLELEMKLTHIQRMNRWSFMLIGCFAVGLAILWMESLDQVIWAKKINLVDQLGHHRASISMDVGLLVVRDKDGKLLASMSTIDGTELALCDTQGLIRVSLGAKADRAWLRLCSEHGPFNAGGVWLGVASDHSALRFTEEQGNVRASLKADRSGETRILIQDDQKGIWSAP